VEAARGEMPFLDHLEELRRRLIWSLVVLVALSVGGFFVVTGFDVIGLLERPFHYVLPGQDLLFTSPTTPVLVSLKLGFVVGFILASPFLGSTTTSDGTGGATRTGWSAKPSR
jgi:sec-independent protein translocase protein TatC